MSPHVSTPAFAAVSLCLCGVVVLGAAGCFYTGRINRRPAVQIVGLQSHYQRGATVMVNAAGSDPDGDALRYAWYVADGACGAPPAPTKAPDQVVAPPLAVMLSPDAVGSVCVWVIASDGDGAVSDPAFALLSTTNQAPSAIIDVQKPSPNASATYDLYSLFRLSAGRSSDADRDPIASYQWTLAAAPDRSTAALVPCSPGPADDTVRCLDVGDVPGQYVVSLRVDDGYEPSAPVEARLLVEPDRPPCLGTTNPPADVSPLVWDPSETRELAVLSVGDDGAPLPAVEDGAHHYPPTFAWSMRRNGAAWEALAGFESLSKVTLRGGSFASGDTVDVRVTISDGQPTHQRLPPAGCKDTTTWTVEYR